MNIVILMGGLVDKPELISTGSNSYTRFSLGITKVINGEKSSDYVNCIAWNKTAELITKYCDKGSQVIIQGRIQTSSYTKDGARCYKTDVVANSVKFISKPKKAEVKEEPKAEDPFEMFGKEVVINDEELPF